MKTILKYLIYISIGLLFIGIVDIIKEKLYDADLPTWFTLIVVTGYFYLITHIHDWILPGMDNLLDAFTAEIDNPAAKSIRQIAKKSHRHPPSINSTKSLRLANSSNKNHGGKKCIQ